MSWLKSLNTFLRDQLAKYDKVIVLGDFNIAPADIDVHNPMLWEESVLCSKKEREAFHKILELGFIDCFRQLHPDETLYSWWDYRMAAFRRNMGLRIDHILANTPLLPHCTKCYIDKAPRTWERPSDHAPVVAEFKI